MTQLYNLSKTRTEIGDKAKKRTHLYLFFFVVKHGYTKKIHHHLCTFFANWGQIFDLPSPPPPQQKKVCLLPYLVWKIAKLSKNFLIFWCYSRVFISTFKGVKKIDYSEFGIRKKNRLTPSVKFSCKKINL